MAVSKVQFKCNDSCYLRKVGLALDAYLAVVLAILWLKDYEKVLSKDIPLEDDILAEMNEKCPICIRRVTFRTKTRRIRRLFDLVS